MAAIVMGAITTDSLSGDIDAFDNPILPYSGASNVDAIVGAFANKGGLPEDLASLEDWDALAAAMLAKTVGGYDGGITVDGLLINRFVGVGGGGDDRFEVDNRGVVRMDGRGGDDVLTCSGVNTDDTLNGGDGADRLAAASGADVLDGGEGDDTLRGDQGDDTMRGAGGVDTLEFDSGNDLTVSLAEAGPQTFGAFQGTDLISGFENLSGSRGGDHLTGDGLANRLHGHSSNDTLIGGRGDDTLSGGVHDDSLSGGEGFDWISYADAPSGMTVLLYADLIMRNGFREFDHATGVEGIIGSAYVDDLAGDAGANAIRAGDGNDSAIGQEDADTIDGGAGADIVWGEAGNDLLVGGDGDDSINGGHGGDTADYRGAAAPVTVNLLEGGPQATGGAGTDTLIGIEGLIGSSFRDVLSGDVGANRLDGRGGSDILHGRGGNDTLIGAAGKDLIDGNVGADRMTGGPGKDRYYYDAPDEFEAAEPDVITDLAAEDRILLTSIDAKADKAGNQAFELVEALTGRSGQAALTYDAGEDVTELRLDMDGDAVADGVILLLGDHRDFINFAL